MAELPLLSCPITLLTIQTPASRRPDAPRKCATLCITLALVFCSAIAAWADLVSGRVYDPDGNVVKSASLEVVKGDAVVNTFTTDGSGNFTVYLEPGTYRVRMKGQASLEGTIQGYQQPVRQDIRLQKR